MVSLHRTSIHSLQVTLWIVCVVTASSHQIDDDRREDSSGPPHGKSDDIKRPFGGGVFSRSRPQDNRWSSGPRSLTPWPMSKYVVRHEAKRHSHQRHPSSTLDDEINWLRLHDERVNKRPFGPGVFSRPRATRVEKRPFGGSQIFSRPRGSQRYRTQRERRGELFEHDSPIDWNSEFQKLREEQWRRDDQWQNPDHPPKMTWENDSEALHKDFEPEHSADYDEREYAERLEDEGEDEDNRRIGSPEIPNSQIERSQYDSKRIAK